MSGVSEDELSSALDALASKFIVPAGRYPRELAVVVQLGIRADSFRRAIERERAEAPAAAMVLLRALIDLLILTLWVERCPKLHVALWAAEGDRQHLEHYDEIERFLGEHGLTIDPARRLAPEVRARVVRTTERYRALARKHGELISRVAGASLMPSVRDRLRNLPVSELELYDIGFGQMSNWTHSRAPTFGIQAVEVEPGDWYLVPTPNPNAGSVRRFAIAVQAGAGAAISRMLGLGDEDIYDAIRASARSGGTVWESG
jgi:hypothetical protein